MAVDAQDHVHACFTYVTDSTFSLGYATDKTGTLVTTLVEPGGLLGQSCHIALDAQGYPHISSWGGGPLKHAWEDAAGWHTEFVANVPKQGITDDIAIDPTGTVHIIMDNFYVDGANGNVVYYTRQPGGAWTSEVAVPHGSFGALAIGTDGVPQIACYGPGYTLGYAYKSGNTWIQRIIDADSPTGNMPGIAVDSQNRPHIAYLQGFGAPVRDHVRYATMDATGKWETEYVDLTTRINDGTSIVVDHNDRPRIAWDTLGDQAGVTRYDLGYAAPASTFADTRALPGG